VTSLLKSEEDKAEIREGDRISYFSNNKPFKAG